MSSTEDFLATPARNSEVPAEITQDALDDDNLEEPEKSLVTAQFTSSIPGFRRDAALLDAGGGMLWFDIAVVRNNVTILNGRFDPSIDLPGAREIHQKILETKLLVSHLLDQLITLSDHAETWRSRIPNFPVTRKQVTEAEDHQKRTIKVCLDAQNKTAWTRNHFLGIYNLARSLKRELELSINQLRYDRERLYQAKETDWNSYKSNGWNSLVPNEHLRAGFDEQWRPRLTDMESRVQKYQSAVNTRATFSYQSETWQKLCESVSSNLGTMYNALTAIRLDAVGDTALYNKLLNGQWQSLRNNTNEARGVLGFQSQEVGAFGDVKTAPACSVATVASNSTDPAEATLIQTDLVPSPTPPVVAHEPNGTVPTEPIPTQATLAPSSPSSVAVPESDDLALAQAMSPQTTLTSLLSDQALDATDIMHHFENMKKFTQLDDVLVTENAEASTPLTLGKALLEVKLSLSNMMSSEYDVVQQLFTMAIIQPTRFQKLTKGRLKVSSALKGSETYLDLACRSAEEARREYISNTANLIATIAGSKAVKSTDVAFAGLGTLHESLVRLGASVIEVSSATQSMRQSLQTALSLEDADSLRLTDDQATEISHSWENIGEATEKWFAVMNELGVQNST